MTSKMTLVQLVFVCILCTALRGNGWVELSKIIPVSEFKAELAELDNPAEIGLLVKEVKAYNPSTTEYNRSMVNLFRAIADTGDERFLAFMSREAQNRSSDVSYAAGIALERLRLRGVPARERVDALSELFKKAKSKNDHLEMLELVRAIACEREHARAFLRQEHDDLRAQSEPDRQMIEYIYIGMVFAEMDEALPIIEEKIRIGGSRLEAEYMRAFLGVDDRACYWKIKTKNLSFDKKMELLLPKLAWVEENRRDRFEYGKGAYLYLYELGERVVSQLEKVALTRSMPLPIRRPCISLLFDLGAEEPIKRLAHRVNKEGESPQIVAHVRQWLSYYEKLQANRQKRPRFGARHMAPPVFKGSE